MAMNTKVQKWGNSLALRIPKALAAGANVVEGTTVIMRVSDGRLIVEPTRGPHYDLDDLLAGIDSASLHEETGTGPSVGRETW